MSLYDFYDFSPLMGVDASYATYDLGGGFKVKVPDASGPRWLPPSTDAAGKHGLPVRDKLYLLNTSKGEVTARMWRQRLDIGQTTVRRELWRTGVATAMMQRVFAVAVQHGATHTSGTVFNRKALGMYSKMFGPEHITIGETSADTADLEGVIAQLPEQHWNDDYFAAYEIPLAALRPEYVFTVPDTTGLPHD